MRVPRWKLITYALVIVAGLLSVLPNLLTPAQLSRLPGWVSDYQITLGLDLRGGSHLVLEVDGNALVRERLDTIAEDAQKRLRDAGFRGHTVRVSGGIVLVGLADDARRSEAVRLLNALGQAHALSSGSPAVALDAPADGSIRLTLTEDGLRDRINAAVEQSLEVVRQRIDEIGVSEPTVQRVNADRILVQLPGIQDPGRIKTLLGSTAKMTFHRVLPQGLSSGAGTLSLPDRSSQERLTVERRATLSGEHLVDAAPAFDAQTREPVVSFRLNVAGARIFGKFTQSHVGEPFAIVLDGKVLSAPVIREAIMGGAGQISGGFSVQEASDLAALLRAGALPAPLTIVEERTVGADLGADAIAMGAWTGLAGFGLVFAFMTALYGGWGLIANLALLLNVALTLGALSWLGATLTLPGIAGIILGIGLAVDANVLINERIREETRKGMSALAALDAGFKRAYATIVDSNVTTLIATTLLFIVGSGPVRGFAVTMGLGILISMFTAVSVVRLLMEWVVRKCKLKQLHIRPVFRLVPDGTQIRFMRARFIGIGLSILLSLASVALFVKPGLNYGIDFRGGILMEVRTPGPADLSALRGALSTSQAGDLALQTFGNNSTVLVRSEQVAGGDAAQNQAVDRMKVAVLEVAPGADFQRVEVVGPKISGELVEAGVLAVIFASMAMLAYIWARFEWPFAVGAIATLVLDITKTVGFFALTGMDFNLTAIAALLTLIGYSVNDKVVVYDRMRENLRLYKQASLRDIIDRSINETLGRSLYTSITAFLAMLPMALFGGPAVASFAIPMLFGIAIAASSSVFIAAPLLLLIGDWRLRRRLRMQAQVPQPTNVPA